MQIAWDSTNLYVGGFLQENHIWATLTEKNSIIYRDDDFEIFIDPDADGLNYYEFEINALGTIWELNLPKPYGEGGKPRLGCNIPGLKRRVRVAGTLNDPSDVDEGWTVEVAIPWRGLAEYHSGGTRT